MSTQPEAIRLAYALKSYSPLPWAKTAHDAAAELRRLHEVNQGLLEASKQALKALDDRSSLMKWQAARESLRQTIAKATGENK